MSVVVLGSINLDMTVSVDRIPKPGETILSKKFVSMPGGKGANQALAACRMGAHTTLLGAVGEDVFAIQALQLLRKDGVNLTRVSVAKQAPTGLAFISVADMGENAITVAPGANQSVGGSALKDLSQILTSRDILLIQAEIPLDVIEQAVIIAHDIGALVIWDPAPATKAFPLSLFSSDIIVPNQGEAMIIQDVTISDVRSAKAAARQLCIRGAKVGIVKLGEQGVVWATTQGLFYQPGEAVTVVDTVGAGDMFAGALAARLDAGDSLGDAIRVANKAASLSTTKAGAQGSFPWKKDVIG